VFDLVALDTAGSGPAYLPKIAVTLPSGWSSYDGFGVNNGVVSVSFWDVNKVYPTPCKWQSKRMIDPGATVDGLASALARQPLRNATTPTNAVLAGVRGKYLRLSVPRHINFAQCDRGYFETWTGLGWASDRWEQGPGQVDRVWILNVDGQRLVVDANYLPSATATDRAQLDRVVHSIRFLRIASSTTTRASTPTTGRVTTKLAATPETATGSPTRPPVWATRTVAGLAAPCISSRPAVGRSSWPAATCTSSRPAVGRSSWPARTARSGTCAPPSHQTGGAWHTARKPGGDERSSW
jgi:hypothetical protein